MRGPIGGESRLPRRRMLTAMILGGLLAGCSGSGNSPGVSNGAASCSVTQPTAAPAALVREANNASGWFGNDGLWAALPAPEYRPDRLPSGLYDMKIGWWRLKDGALVVRADRLDALGDASADTPRGYGARGFQPTGVLFPQPGCWRVTGVLGATSVSFTVRVIAP